MQGRTQLEEKGQGVPPQGRQAPPARPAWVVGTPVWKEGGRPARLAGLGVVGGSSSFNHNGTLNPDSDLSLRTHPSRSLEEPERGARRAEGRQTHVWCAYVCVRGCARVQFARV
jgi:hypothetical protein